ncbi:MAG: glycoside hydrolase family 16 protein [Myxococcales bacterium]|nr:glycoside hydrolase family 16 protein [Myxococcales bacterium]
MRTVSFAVLLGASACTFSLPQENDDPVWELVWEDEFRGEVGASPDPDNWTFEIGNGGPDLPGWGNQEIQYYTDRPDNASLDGDGFLRIVAQQENFEDFEWTSARMTSKALQEFQYGRIEIRALAPTEPGIWPALWMLGADIDENPWPLCGEIDIMEVFGDRSVGVNVHGPGYSGGNPVGAEYDGVGDDFASDFHTYEIVWDPDHITWLIDGNLVRTVSPADLPPFTPWVFDHPFFLILNVAVGGLGPGPVTPDTPQSNLLAVDYVRVYERAEPLVDPAAPSG